MRRSVLLTSQAIVIAVAMFMTSVKCFCGTTTPEHRCCHCGHQEPKSQAPPCPHCMGAMATEHGQGWTFDRGISAIGVATLIDICPIALSAEHFSFDHDSPLKPPSSLLCLHCALNV